MAARNTQQTQTAKADAPDIAAMIAAAVEQALGVQGEAKPAASAKASTQAKMRRVSVPSHVNREAGYRVEPCSRFHGHTLFTYLNEDGTDGKTKRLQTPILRDMLASEDAAAVAAFEWPEAS
jgi:hypothetical protein